VSDDVADTPCPGCGEKKLRIEWRLTAQPLGSFSLSGHSMKVSATSGPWLVCDGCGIEAQGHR
jgi:hypothetical protein